MSDRIAQRHPTWNLQQILTCLIYLLIIKVIVGVVVNYRDYLPPNLESEFLQGREPYFFGSYRWAFYVHIASGPVSLILGMLLISERFRIWSPRRHRILGRLQTINVLLLVVPSGQWMAIWSDAGPAGISGFSALAVATGVCCVQGWRMAVRRRFAAHRRWMWRCSLLLCSAVTLRMIGGIVEIAGLNPAWTYPVAAWISWLVPLGVLEWSLMRTLPIRKSA